MQQIEYRAQPRLRTDEILLMQAHEPFDRLLCGGCEVIIPFIVIFILAQPAVVAVRPDLQIILGRPAKGLALCLPLGIVKEQVKVLQELLRLDATALARDELPVEERRNERSLVGSE